MNRRATLIILLLTLTVQPACFLKFWGKGDKQVKEKEAKVKIYNIYGTVQEISRESLSIDSKKGPMQFTMAPSSIKGSDFKAKAYVHVYYKQENGENVVTMVVEKIK